ncbi:MAG TPA: GTPase Era [Solirubrobacteraceae bacterium]|jgi:GTP-binding protein Era|nr:GTPase Era [Solirubrobacteraceae bacterium]
MSDLAGQPDAAATRSGFVALAGRPNVGKSTLVNAIVGGKVAIVSDRPQTTRRAIRGVRSEQQWQIVLVDLPGVQRPRDMLTERMAGRVRLELEGSDAALLVLNGEQGVGAGDRYIAQALGEVDVPVTIAINKVDRLDRAATVAVLAAAAELDLSGEIFPISARTGKGVGALVEHLAELMPQGPFMFSAQAISDQPLSVLLAELVREAAIRRTFQELPHAVEAIVEEIEHPRDGLVRVRALLWVETESQKGIVVGAGGRMIKAIGSAARKEIERELGCHVHLDLSVRVRRDWRGDEGLLDRLGIT